MSATLKKETAEWILDKDYEINFVSLTTPELCHTHRFIELVYTLKGKGIHKINGKEYLVERGDMLIINYRDRHTVEPVENLGYVDIMLKPEFVNKALIGTEDLFLILQLSDFSDLSSAVIKDNVAIHFDGDERKKVEFLLDWTREEQDKALAANDLVQYSALNLLLCLVFRKMAENQSIRLSINNFLLSYIQNNCHNRLFINEMASMCGYTPEHFSRIFKKFSGKSPKAYVLECRINKARELLATTDKSVETIIDECGFSDRTAFFRAFSSHTGCTPLQYRKNQK